MDDLALRAAVFNLARTALLNLTIDVVAVRPVACVQVLFDGNLCSNRHKVILPLIGFEDLLP
jgi:hypothetical protein